MVNVNKLKAKLVELELNVETVAGQISIDKATLYRHLKTPDDITIKEADAIAKVLDLTRDEFTAIFFAQYVA